MSTELDLKALSFSHESPLAAVLERLVLPEIFRDTERVGVRAWVPSCGTGEDAYWLAMVLTDYVDEHGLTCDVRVFATDGDNASLTRARRGLYPRSVADQLSPDRLTRHFYLRPDGYQITKRIRDTVLFSAHDLRSDPPFSRLDLVMGERAFSQLPDVSLPDVVRALHYGLSPGGHLLLGRLPPPAALTEFFRALVEDSGVLRTRNDRIARLPRARRTPGRLHSFRSDAKRAESSDLISVARRTERLLLETYAPRCVVVDQALQIVHVAGNLDGYLQPPEGPPTRDLRRMLRPDLSGRVLALALAAQQEGAPQIITLEQIGKTGPIQLSVTARPLAGAANELCALVFEERAPTPSSASAEATNDRVALQLVSRQLERLKGEFRLSSEHLQSTNEELRSMNEELESANEELEIARGQLNSLNEELETTNTELKNNLFELELTNTDLRTLLQNTPFPLVFLDTLLNIRNFTLAAQELFSLIPSDCGRPLRELAQRFRYDGLFHDVERILHTRASKETTIQASSGRWYTLRILPYSSSRGAPDGVMLCFSDGTQLRSAETGGAALRDVV